MLIRLEGNDPSLNSSLVTDLSQDKDGNDLFPGGATISFHIDEIRESTGTPEVISMIVSFTGQAITNIALNLFSSWLWNKFTQKNVKKIEIEGLSIDFSDEGKFKRILADKIKIEE